MPRHPLFPAARLRLGAGLLPTAQLRLGVGLVAATTVLATLGQPVLAASGVPDIGRDRSLASPAHDASLTIGPQRDYIVVFRDATDVARKTAGLAHSLAVRATHQYKHAFKGFAAPLTANQYQRVAADPAVDYIVPDRPVHLDGQVVPTGIRRIGGASNDTMAIDGEDTRVDADIAIVDTGMQRDHPDLNVVGGYNCSTSAYWAWSDGHGHGTHVAGTAAALDNGIGVVGAAPGARLWAVKVFDNYGNGRLSWYACGLDWVVSQRDPADPMKPRMEVANMSLRTVGSNDNACGWRNNDLLHKAICRAVNDGTTVVVAAGNDSGYASRYVPASYPEVITVSALADFNGLPGGGAPSTCSSWGSPDADDTFANFSNYGSVVDIMASGKCIYSTYLASSYKLMSGTSMATPAVSGAVALWKSLHPDHTPSQAKLVLQAAGRMDWAWWTDPDATHERMLNVSSFGHGPDFSLASVTPRRAVGVGGGSATYRIDITRGDAFGGPIDLMATDLPEGFSASFEPARATGLRGLSATMTVMAPSGLADGVYDFTVSGTSQDLGMTRTTPVRLVVDRTPPTAGAPWVRLTGPQLGTTYVPVRVAWSGQDPSGIGKYYLQMSKDGGGFTPVATYGGSTTAAIRWLRSGHLYQFRVAAVDAFGNTGAWAAGRAFRVGVYDQSHRAVRFSRSWRRAYPDGAWAGSVRYSPYHGARAKFTFFGRQIAWVAPRGSTRGTAIVRVDGAIVGNVSLYSSSTSARRVVFIRTWAEAGTHTIDIGVLGTKGHPRVDVDAFVVIR